MLRGTQQAIVKGLPKSTALRVVLVGTILISVVGSVFLLTRFTQSKAEVPASVPVAQAVTALGRLEPRGEVIKLSPAAANGNGSRVAKLLVKQSDLVQKGQVVAILDTYDTKAAALEKANRQVEIAQTQLAQVEAGAKQGEIKAQQATIEQNAVQRQTDLAAKDAAIARLQAEVDNATLEYRRYASLLSQGAVSASLRDSKQLTLETTKKQLDEAKANRQQSAETLAKQGQVAESTLEKIAEVRPVDVQVAQAQVRSAMAEVQQAQADLALAVIRAPRAGQILKIYTWEGEVVGNNGIAELGQTDRMVAVAEVYESDIKTIKKGQRAIVTSSAFDGEAQGTVDEIGLQIRKKDVLDTDPTAKTDARVIEVKVLLDPVSSRQVAGLTNLEVTVQIAKP